MLKQDRKNVEVELRDFKVNIDTISNDIYGIEVSGEYNDEDLLFYAELHDFDACDFVTYYAKKYDLID